MTPIQTQNLLNIINKGETPTPLDLNRYISNEYIIII